MKRKVGGGILANFDTVFSRFYDDVTGNLLSTVENNQSSLATRFISGDDLDQVFAQIRYSNGQLQTYNWWVTDLEGTPHQIMSEEATAPGMGSLLAQDYTAYGRPVDTNGAASAQPLPASYQAGYTARDYDEISGLQWNRARWYDPVLGQWLSNDPIGFSAGDSNIRRYVRNSPTNATDPSGLADEKLNPKTVLSTARQELASLVAKKRITVQEAQFRYRILQNALQKKIKFEGAGGPYRNRQYWTDYGEASQPFTVRRDRRPHDAIEDIWKHKENTRTGCRKAADLILFKACIDYLRDREQDKQITTEELDSQLTQMDTYIGFEKAPEPIGKLYIHSESTAEEDLNGGFADGDFLPGDNVVFDNPFKREYPGHGTQGSNVFYAGDGVYVGYDGFIYVNREAVQKKMDKWVPGEQQPKEFPAGTLNRPVLPDSWGME